MINNKRILIILGFVIIIILLISFFIYSLQFRLLSTNTKNNVLASSSDRLILTFNQDINPNLDISSENITVEPKSIINIIKINGNNLEFIFNQNNFDYNLSIKIKKIESTKNKTIHNFNKIYKIEYKDLSKLSKEEQKRQINQSDSSESLYPIIKSLPIITNEYIVDYKLPNQQYENSNNLILTIDVIGVPNDNKAIAEENALYTEQIRAKALQDIQNRGYIVEDYVVVYTENENNKALD